MDEVPAQTIQVYYKVNTRHHCGCSDPPSSLSKRRAAPLRIGPISTSESGLTTSISGSGSCCLLLLARLSSASNSGSSSGHSNTSVSLVELVNPVEEMGMVVLCTVSRSDRGANCIFPIPRTSVSADHCVWVETFRRLSSRREMRSVIKAQMKLRTASGNTRMICVDRILTRVRDILTMRVRQSIKTS